MRVFITGGTGLVGGRLVSRLLERSDTPVVLSRNQAAARTRFGPSVEVVEGDPTVADAWQVVVGTCDAVVHLAGENIFANRWNERVKAALRDSRVVGTRNVVQAIDMASRKPRVLVSASAVGYYGPRGDEPLTEESPPGADFLAGVCVEWESAARTMQAPDVRLVIVRIGVVISPDGGALAQMLTPFKLGVGGPVGNGRQWMSWVHTDDVIGVILHAVDSADVSGILNATAPEAVSNKQFSKALGRALGRPSFFPVPVFMLRLRFGQVAEVIATGQRVLPRRAQMLGYKFRFPLLDEALADVLHSRGRKENR
jgi:uncharacterized protein (TIGR01777 family)